jgi:aspartate oxidase
MLCSYKPADEVLAHFPNIAAQCRDYGIDITREPIPVAPAQHYMCGGVQVITHPQCVPASSQPLAVLEKALW